MVFGVWCQISIQKLLTNLYSQFSCESFFCIFTNNAYYPSFLFANRFFNLCLKFCECFRVPFMVFFSWNAHFPSIGIRGWIHCWDFFPPAAQRNDVYDAFFIGIRLTWNMPAHLPRKAVHLSIMDATYSVQRRAEIVTRSSTSTTVSVPNLNVTVISKKHTTQPLAGFQAPVWACDVRKFLSAHQG